MYCTREKYWLTKQTVSYFFVFRFFFRSMSSKGNCKENVLKYLNNQNRPYSANDIMQNLHKEFGKTAVQKALDDLTLECKIKEKTYGKQKVYSAIQEEEDKEGDVALELTALDSKIEAVSEKLRSVEQDLKRAEGTLKELENEPSTENALKEKNELMASIARFQERIDALSKTPLQITEEEKGKISKAHENYTKEHKKRKQICMNIVDSIMENYPKKLKTLLEEIGIETDDAA